MFSCLELGIFSEIFPSSFPEGKNGSSGPEMFWQDDGPNLIVTLTPEEVRSLKIKHGRSKDDSSITASLESLDLGKEETKSVSKPKHSLFLSSEMATSSLQRMKELGITHVLVPADNAGARHKKVKLSRF